MHALRDGLCTERNVEPNTLPSQRIRAGRQVLLSKSCTATKAQACHLGFGCSAYECRLYTLPIENVQKARAVCIPLEVSVSNAEAELRKRIKDLELAQAKDLLPTDTCNSDMLSLAGHKAFAVYHT